MWMLCLHYGALLSYLIDQLLSVALVWCGYAAPLISGSERCDPSTLDTHPHTQTHFTTLCFSCDQILTELQLTLCLLPIRAVVRFFQKVVDCWFCVHCVLVTFILCVCCEVNLQQGQEEIEEPVCSFHHRCNGVVCHFFLFSCFLFHFFAFTCAFIYGEKHSPSIYFLFSTSWAEHTGINAIYARNKHCRAVSMVTLLWIFESQNTKMYNNVRKSSPRQNIRALTKAF